MAHFFPGPGASVWAAAVAFPRLQVGFVAALTDRLRPLHRLVTIEDQAI